MIFIVWLLLLVLWMGLVIVGFVIKAVAWLAIVGLALSVVTAVAGTAYVARR